MKDADTMIALGDLCGVSEVAELLERTKGRVDQLLLEDPTFPRPIWHMRVGRLWDAKEIRAWMRGNGYNMSGYQRNPIRRRQSKNWRVVGSEFSEAERGERIDSLLGHE